MIVIDTSAVMAILEFEPERDAFIEAIIRQDRCLMSSVSYPEAGQVIFARKNAAGLARFDALIFDMGVEVVPHDSHLARLAVQAFARYGKGIHSRARLNFGDCATYALAQSRGLPLLFKGNDFAATDLAAAV